MALEILVDNVSSAVILGLAMLALMFYKWNRRPSGIPPFPVTPLPFVGNLLSLKKDSRDLFAKWRHECGDIYSLYMANRLVIVLNGYEIIRDALVKNADVFSDRPSMFITDRVFRGQGISATSGAVWKSQRKFALTALRDFGFGQNILEEKILQEIEDFVGCVQKDKGVKKDYGHMYESAVSNIMCSMVFGKRFDYDDPKFLDILVALDTLVGSLSATGALANFFPILEYVPGDLFNIKAVLKNVEYYEVKLIKPEIERHFKEYDGSADDFISAYIKEIKDRESAGEETKDLRDNFTQTVSDLFIAGTETTATTLKWLVLFLIQNTEIQEKCFQEIKEKVGLGRLPALKDKASLPYVEAVLAETQRRANIVPFGISHGVSEDTTFRGYKFPKDVIVMPNMSSILMDPKLWPDPDDFRPERFMDKDGKFSKPKEFVPFSLGRRVCLGESLAKMELFLFATALIQRFQLKQPEDELPISLVPIIGGTALPAPYKVQAASRE